MLSLPELVSAAHKLLIPFSIAFIFTISACTIIRSIDLSILTFIMRPQKGLPLPSLDRSRLEQARCWKYNAVGLVQQAYIKVCHCLPLSHFASGQIVCSNAVLIVFLLQFPGRVFQVFALDGPQVFIPPNLMDEIMALPDNILSISDGVKEVSSGDIWIKRTPLMGCSCSRPSIPCFLTLETRNGLHGQSKILTRMLVSNFLLTLRIFLTSL
jgi:hypothetical protein